MIPWGRSKLGKPNLELVIYLHITKVHFKTLILKWGYHPKTAFSSIRRFGDSPDTEKKAFYVVEKVDTIKHAKNAFVCAHIFLFDISFFSTVHINMLDTMDSRALVCSDAC